MDIDQFLSLPSEQVAGLVRGAGPKVCVFPINGTRRWFLLEYPPETWQGRGFLEAFHEFSVERQFEIFRLFFDHGIDTLMMPLVGPDIMERGIEYQRMMVAMLTEMATDPAFLNFYKEYGVRVRFYGDYRKYFCGTPFYSICDVFDRLEEQTAHHSRCRLLVGLFAHDAAETVAALAVRHFKENGVLPNKRQIVELYYGEWVPPVSFFIGFDRFSAFDMPLVSTGSEDLYFTVGPSFAITQNQLRHILYDHLVSRRCEEQEYESLSPGAVERMRAFYAAHRESTLGVGVVRDGFWYPYIYSGSVTG